MRDDARRAIRSAMLQAATLLGQSERLGAIETGKAADIAAVPGDPIANITLMELRDEGRHRLQAA